ncbi:hypothetical protein GQ457_12G016550 [Hibiscus cannabinus]
MASVESRAGFLKFNIGGAKLGHKTGCGDILREVAGIVHALFSGPVVGADPKFARLVAVNHGLELFRETNWVGNVDFIVEVDSQVVLNWFATLAQRPWSWWSPLVAIDILVK